jgi:hypothetical protein
MAAILCLFYMTSMVELYAQSDEQAHKLPEFRPSLDYVTALEEVQLAIVLLAVTTGEGGEPGGPNTGVLSFVAVRSDATVDSVAFTCGSDGHDCSGTFSPPGESVARFFDRFSVRATWEDPASGREGVAGAIPWPSGLKGAQTAFFWFFGPGNIELVAKVLDGCGTNGHWWVFLFGGTNLNVSVTATDSWSGVDRFYESSGAFEPRFDVEAFTCSTTDPAEIFDLFEKPVK